MSNTSSNISFLHLFMAQYLKDNLYALKSMKTIDLAELLEKAEKEYNVNL